MTPDLTNREYGNEPDSRYIVRFFFFDLPGASLCLVGSLSLSKEDEIKAMVVCFSLPLLHENSHRVVVHGSNDSSFFAVCMQWCWCWCL